jgi:hypothetical protein
MNARRLLIVAVAAVLAILGAILLATQRNATREGGVGERVLPELDGRINEVTQLTLARHGTAGTTLVRRDGTWLVAERDYPADVARLRKLLVDLAALRVIEPKTREPGNYAQLGLADPTTPGATGTLVTVNLGAATPALIVGRASGARSVFVRRADEAGSVLAGPLVTADPDPKRWIDATLLDVDAAAVREIRVSPAGSAPYRLLRAEKGASLALVDLPRGMVPRGDDAIAPLAGMLDDFTVTDVAAAETGGATTQGARTTVSTFDGLVIDIAGRESAERRYVTIAARAADGADEATRAAATALAGRTTGREFEVPRYKYDALFRPRADFLESP